MLAKLLTIFSLLFFFAVPTNIYSDSVLKNGRWINKSDVAKFTAEEHFKKGKEAFDQKDYPKAAKNFKIITLNFPSSEIAQESYYLLGVAYFNEKEYDLANDAFTEYLKFDHPPLFRQVIEYKFTIAEKFCNGANKRFFGVKNMPKLASGKNLALEIYDEIISSVPADDLASRALFSKAKLLCSLRHYQECIDTLQILIRRFPKHELGPEAYVMISQAYLLKSEYEYQNPDLISFAELNLKKFEQDYPSEERISLAKEYVCQIKEVYASGLYETGCFYERKKKPHAAIVYFKKAITDFPDTTIAKKCQSKLTQY
jgi:outer membrane protein assembly factor BamD (BamD/ComL family)